MVVLHLWETSVAKVSQIAFLKTLPVSAFSQEILSESWMSTLHSYCFLTGLMNSLVIFKIYLFIYFLRSFPITLSCSCTETLFFLTTIYCALRIYSAWYLHAQAQLYLSSSRVFLLQIQISCVHLITKTFWVWLMAPSSSLLNDKTKLFPPFCLWMPNIFSLLFMFLFPCTNQDFP